MLCYYIATYLGYPSPATISPGSNYLANAFLCPAAQRYTPNMGKFGLCYIVVQNQNTVNLKLPWQPFGYPSFGIPFPGKPSHKISEVATNSPLSKAWMLVDVDQMGSGNPWSPTLVPSLPSHGNVRNYLFFDGHVSPIKVGAAGTYY